jgi:hypothetical protein
VTDAHRPQDVTNRRDVKAAQCYRPREIPQSIHSQAVGFRLIVEKLGNSSRPILIDEADCLSIKTLGIIRHIHDATGCPVILCGRPNLAKKINRTTRDDDIGGSLRGRLCVEHDLMSGINRQDGSDGEWLFSVDEVAEILRQFKIVFHRDAARWLTMLANLSACDGGREQGGLRYAIEVAKLAIIIAERKRTADRRVTLEIVKQANSLTRDKDYAVQIAHRIAILERQRTAGRKSSVATKAG